MSDDTERWLPVVGHEGAYEVSDQGRVRTLDRRVSRGPGRGTRLERGCVLKQHLNAKKRKYQVGIWRDGKMQLHAVHGLVLAAFVGPRPDGMVGCHTDGDSTNNHLSNLRWDTQSGNIMDSVEQGTHASTRKTNCPRGHALVEPNLDAARLRAGHRICLACKRAANVRRYAIPAGRPFDFYEEAARQYVRIMEAAPVAFHDSPHRQAC